MAVEIESVVTFKCSACGHIEEVESRRGSYFGSSFDFCDECDEPRAEGDMINVVGPMRAFLMPEEKIEC